MRISKRSKVIAGALTGVLLAAGFGGAAIAAPADVSEAQGQFVRTNLPVLGGIVASRGATAEYPSGTYPSHSVPLTGEILSAIVGNLQGSPVIGRSGVINLGVASQYADALPNGDARAGSGAVTNVNGLVLGSTNGPASNATFNVTPLLGSVPVANGVLSQAELDFGALGSTIESTAGVTVRDYLIADADLSLTSPLVSGVYTTLQGQVDAVHTAQVALQNSAQSTILGALNAINVGLLRANGTVSVSGTDVRTLLPSGFVGAGTGVSVNLRTGQVAVDLQQLLAYDTSLPDLNDLDPNEPLLSGRIGNAIANGIVAAITAQVNTALANVRAAVENTRLTANIALEARLTTLGTWQPLAGLVLDAPLSAVNAGTAKFAVTGVVGGTVNGVLGILGLSLDQIGTRALAAVGPLVSTLFGTVTTAENTLRGTTGALSTAVVAPILTALRAVIDVRANVQPATGDLLGSSQTVRALGVSLLGGAATIDLASSTVRGSQPDYASSANLALSPSSLPAGGTTTVNGTGYAPLETVTITGAGVTRTVVANASGAFQTTLTVPGGTAAATYPIRGSGALSGVVKSVDLVVTAPTIAATSPVYRGAETTVTGSGFLPGETVALTRGGAAAGTTTANGSGQISASIAVPANAPTGATAITARGATSAATATTSTTVLAYDPAISASPSALQAGQSTTITGLGFAPNESVSLTYGGVTTTTTANASGRISAAITVPNGRAAGQLEVSATGAVSNAARTATLTVLPYTPAIAVDPSVVERGASTTITGTGFAAGEAVTVAVGGVSEQVFASPTGTITLPRTIAGNAALGATSVTAIGAVSNVGVTASLTVVSGDYQTTLTLSPDEVEPGESTDVTGTGFEPGESGTVLLAGVSAPFTADGDGEFTVGVTIPLSATPGPYQAVATGQTSQTPASATLTVDGFAPVVTADPGTRYPGQTSTITATDLPPNQSVTFDFGGAGDPITTTSSPAGTATVQYTVPNARAAGPVTITATTATPASSGSTTLTVVAYAPAISLTPVSGTVGTEVGFVGVGFAPQETVTVVFAGASTTATADADGEIEGTFTVPDDAPLGADPVTATGIVSGVPATSTFTVDPIVYTTTLELTPASVLPGGQTAISGGGFAPGETVDITIGGVTVSQNADADGRIATNYTVPAGTAPQSYTVTAEGRVSQTPASAVLDVQPIVYTTEIAADPAVITAGQSTTILGGGFAPGETVTVTVAEVSATGAANGDGDVSIPVTLPTTTRPADYTVTATGGTSQKPATTTLTVQAIVYATAIELDPASVLDGGSTTVSGSGFAPGESVRVTALGSTVDVNANGSGAFSTTVTAPSGTAAGDYPVRAIGVTSATPAEAALTVRNLVFTTSVTATPNPVRPGALLSIAGEGFVEGETVAISVAGASTEVLAGSGGVIEAQLTVPAGTTPAEYAVRAVGAQSQTPATATVTVLPVYAPHLALDPASIGQTGTTTIDGSGFEPGESVTVRVDGDELQTLQAGADGRFSLSYDPPVGTPLGGYPVTAIGASTQIEAQATLTIVTGDYETAIQASPAQQVAGQPVNVTGTGFEPGETLTVALGGTSVETTADPDGGIGTSITVPPGADLGALTITATGVDSQTPATTTITVTAAPVYDTELVADPAAVAPGGTSVVTGSGFASGELVYYSVNGTTSSVTADASGGFQVPVAVPASASPGSLTFEATGQQSQTPASVTITVQDAPPVYNPVLTPEPASVPQGGSVVLRGSGFAPEESVTVSFLGGSETTPADDQGRFTVSFDVPADAALGATLATALGEDSDVEATTTVTITDGAYETTVAVSPNPAAPGSTVTVSGTGYEPGETVDVSVGATPAVATADADGAFTTTVVLPATASGTLVVAAQGRDSATPAAATLAVASEPVYLTDIAADPVQGLPGSSIAVTGENFAPGETVSLLLAGVTTTVTAAADGRIEATLTVPAGAAPGATAIQATGAVSATPASTPFTVLAPVYTPSTTVAPGTVTAGGSVGVTGEGFAPGETVTVTLAGQSVEVDADAGGAFTTSVTVPAGTAPGSYPATATGEVSQRPVTRAVTVQAPVYAPQLSVSPTSVEAGGSVIVSGIGFAPEESVTVSLAGIETGVTTSAGGAFSVPVTVPAGTPAGSTAVSAIGTVSATPASGSVEVTSTPPVYAPAVAFVPGSAPRGGQSSLTGTGFAPGEALSIAVFGATITAAADDDGQFSQPVSVPADAALGAATATVTGAVSASPRSAQLAVTEAAPIEYAPVTSVSPGIAAAGDVVQLTGAGFAPGETVTVAIGGTTVEIAADADGRFTTPVAIPLGTAPGPLAITSLGEDSDVEASSTVTVTAPVYAPSIAASPANGAPGTEVRVVGSGYAPGDPITITLGGTEVGTATAGGSGAFAATITVPVGATPGATDLVATGTTSGSATQPFTVDPVVYTPFLLAAPASVAPGATVTLLGSGFAPGESVTLQLFGQQQTVPADGDGDVTADFVAPDDAGTYPATAEGDESAQQVTAEVTVVDNGYDTELSVTPAGITAGGQVTITGGGFEPGEDVTVTVGTQSTVVPADGDGGFTATFTIPADAPSATLAVSANGAISQTPASGSLTVTAAPAPAPAVVSASPGTVQQGAPVTVTGSGFGAGETVVVAVGGASVDATADADGAFSAVVVVPLDTATGATPVTATGDGTGRSASASVQVTAAVFTPSASASPSTAPQGGSTVVSGTGFRPGETVTAALTGGGSATGTADAAGNVSITLPIALDAAPGATAITVTGGTSGAEATTSVTVQASAPPTYSPSIATGVGPYQPGATVPVTGVGFAPGETVEVAFAGGTTTAVVDGDGRLSTTVTVPADAQPGSLPVTVEGDRSGVAQGTVQVVAAPVAYDPAISTAAGPFAPGASVPVSGIGFAPNESVTLTLLGVEVIATADAQGSFATSISLPSDASSGTATLTALGAVSADPATTSVAVAAAPPVYSTDIAVSPAEGLPGDQVTITGTGFAPNETVRILFAGQRLTATADGTGAFSLRATIPAGATPGDYQVTATGDDSQTPAAETVEVDAVVYNPFLALAPTSVEVGGTTVLNGSGFAPGERVDLALFGEQRAVLADGAGAFSASFTVPAGTPLGVQQATAIGAISQQARSASASVVAGDYSTQLELDPVTAAPGAPVAVTGSGFEPGETVAVTLGGSPAGSGVADGDGSVTVTITVPVGTPGGPIPVVATGAVSATPAGATLQVAFAPTFTADPVSVEAGGSTVLRGAGYAPGETVNLSLFGENRQVTADGAGAFAATFVAPDGITEGPKTATALGTSSQAPRTTTVEVVAGDYVTTIALDPTTAAPGGTATVTGSGFEPGETVTLTIGGATVGTGTAGDDGALSATITVPAGQPAGAVQVIATGAESATPAAAVLTVAYAPFLTAAPLSVEQGGQTVLSGSGYAPGEAVTLTLLGQSRTITADAAGGFAETFTIAADAAVGPAVATARGAVSATPREVTVTVVDGAYSTTIEVAPQVAAPGATVAITGSGFEPGETVTATIAGQPAGSGIADADGDVAFDAIVPAGLPTGPVAVVATGAVSGTPAGATLGVLVPVYATSITIEPGSAAPGAPGTVTGSGFAPGEEVAVTIGGQPAGTGTAGSDGTVSIVIQVPIGLPGGANPVVATGETSQTSANGSIAVVYAPFLTAIPGSVAEGGTTELRGSGFAPGEDVELELFGETRTVSADAQGAFAASFTAPPGLAAGEQTATAEGAVSQTPRTATVQVVDGAYETGIDVTPGSAAPGSTVVVGGTGFEPGETVTVTIGGQPAGSGTAAPDGSVSIPVTVPSGLPAGPAVVTATGEQSATPAVATLVVAYQPSLVADPLAIEAGGSVTLRGAGFAPGEQVALSLFGESRTVTADADGAFSAVFVAPDPLAPGAQNATAVGAISQAPRTAGVTVVPDPVVTSAVVSPGSGAPGQQVTVVGSGFTPGETATVTIGGSPAGTGIVGADGTVTIIATVPAGLPAGATQAIVTGAESATPAAAPFTVAYAPFLSAAPVSVAPGGTITLSGTGFAAGEDVVLSLFGETRTVEADAAGAFSADFTAPATQSEGAATATAVGALSQSPRTAAVTVVDAGYDTGITIEPGTAAPGDEVEIGGTGFEPGETVTVTIGGEPVGTGTAGPDGSVTIVVTVPNGLPAGPVPVQAVGDESGTPAGGTLVVAPVAAPTLIATPASGAPGAGIDVVGIGFAPGETVTIALGGTTLSATVLVGPDGTFSTRITVPLDAAPAATSLTATAASGTASTPFEITDAPPVIDPQLSGPIVANPGDTITLLGSGYAPGERVEVVLAGVTVVVTAGPDGRFSAQLALPASTPPGDYEAIATGATSGAASAPIEIVTVEIPDDTPGIAVDPSVVAPGGTVTVLGSSFQPFELVTIRIGPVSVQVQADAFGVLAATIQLPDDMAPGAYTVVAEGTTSLASTTLTVEAGVEPPVYTPSITIDPSIAPAGSEVTVTGEGFAPGESVTVTVAGEIATVTADARGGFVLAIRIPANAPLGEAIATAVGDESQTIAVAEHLIVSGSFPSTEDDQPGSGGGGIAETGADVAASAALAALLLLLGAGALIGTRRRRGSGA